MKKYDDYGRFLKKAGEYIRKFMVVCCVLCLLGGMTGEQVLTVYASGEEQTSDTKVKIGKKTSASAYIKAKDWPKGPSVESVSAVLMEVNTGTVLYAKNPDTPMYPASITKIMTALLTLENSKLTDTVVYEGEAVNALPPGYVSINAVEGEKMSVEECLRALLMYSANDVANALAVHDSGTIAEFAKKMNERAEEAGAKNTHFNNPSGLHESNHYTTAYDMCCIMRECIKYDAFNEIAGDRIYTLQTNNKRKEAFTFAAKHHMLFPTNPDYYEYCVSGKTGYTSEAGNTLVTYAEKDGMKLVCCVMKAGSGVAYTDTEALFNYGFDNFNVVDVSTEEERFTLKDAGIFASKDMASDTSFNITIPESCYVVLPSGTGLNKVDTDIHYLEDAQDGCFAEIDYLYQDMLVGSARLKMSSTESAGTERFDFDSHAEAETESAVDSETDNGLKNIWNQTRTIDVRIVIGVAAVIVLTAAIAVITAVRRKDDRIRFDRKRKRRR
ncbi:MAG: D-alanyl-D-alanine carboxypeptidase family protein [Lachnospiraceae bacterium]